MAISQLLSVRGIAVDVFDGVTSQAECDAKIDDFIFLCAANGIHASGGVILFAPNDDTKRITITGWHFKTIPDDD